MSTCYNNLKNVNCTRISNHNSKEVNCADIIKRNELIPVPNMFSGSTWDNHSNLVNVGGNCAGISIKHNKLKPNPNTLSGSGNHSMCDVN